MSPSPAADVQLSRIPTAGTRGDRLPLGSRFLKLLLAECLVFFSFGGSLLLSEVLPKPTFWNTFYILPIDEFASRAAVFDRAVRDNIYMRDLFHNPRGGPYAKYGISASCRYMNTPANVSYKSYEGYADVCAFKDIEQVFATVGQTRVHFGYHMNGGRWAYREHTVGTIARYLYCHNVNGDMSSLDKRWLMQNSDGSVNYHTHDKQAVWSTSRYNTVYRTYKRRCLEAAIERISEQWKTHPYLFTHVNGDSETETPSDYNPLARREYDCWRRNSYIYDDDTVVASLWHHPGQTGVSDVVYGPDGSAQALTSPAHYRYYGSADTSSSDPGWQLLLITAHRVTPPYENSVVSYRVVGGVDNGETFRAKVEDFRGQGRGRATDSYDNFLYAMNEHLVEDYAKWMYLKFVELGHDPADVCARIFSHEVGVSRCHVSHEDSPGGGYTATQNITYGGSGVTRFAVDKSLMQKARDYADHGAYGKNIQGISGNWADVECNPSKGYSSYSRDKKWLNKLLSYGCHLLCPLGWRVPKYEIYQDAGYERAAMETIWAREWKPYNPGEDNHGEPAVVYIPPKVNDVYAVVRGGASIKCEVSWDRHIWPDVYAAEGYVPRPLWHNWPQFDHFEIYRSGSYGSIGSLVGKSERNTYTDEGLQARTDYYYTVKAVNTDGNRGAASDQQQAVRAKRIYVFSDPGDLDSDGRSLSTVQATVGSDDWNGSPGAAGAPSGVPAGDWGNWTRVVPPRSSMMDFNYANNDSISNPADFRIRLRYPLVHEPTFTDGVELRAPEGYAISSVSFDYSCNYDNRYVVFQVRNEALQVGAGEGWENDVYGGSRGHARVDFTDYTSVIRFCLKVKKTFSTPDASWYGGAKNVSVSYVQFKPYPAGNYPITFSMTGPATWEDGTTGDRTVSEVDGVATVRVKSGTEPGTVVISASSPSLAPGTRDMVIKIGSASLLTTR